MMSPPSTLFVLLLLLYKTSGDFPMCTADNMGDNPFCFPPDYNKDLIPPQNESLQVNVETFIFEISKIDDISLTMTFELYLDLTWRETRIIINDTHPAWGASDAVMGSTNFIPHMWLPDIQIYKCKQFLLRQIVTDVAGLIIFKNKNVLYTVSTEVIIVCPMNFAAYPLDHQICKFRVGSYIHDNTQIYFTGKWAHDIENQRAQQYVLKALDLDYNDTFIEHADRIFSQTGFQVEMVRRRTPVLLQVYLTTGLFIIVSWISFIVPPEVVPGRMALLVTLFLVLVNIFNSVTGYAPKAEGLTAVETWVVSCIIHVFGVLAEYALILKMIQNIKRNEVRERKREQREMQRQMEATRSNSELNLYRPAETHEGGKQCLVKGDGETSVLRNGGKAEAPFCPESNNARLNRQIKRDVKNEKHKELQELVDKVALYLFPCLFMVFNLIYWPYYLVPIHTQGTISQE